MVHGEEQYVHDELLVLIKACDESDGDLFEVPVMVLRLIEQAAVVPVGHHIVLFIECINPALQVVLYPFRHCDDGVQLIDMVLDRKSTRLNSSHVSISYA